MNNLCSFLANSSTMEFQDVLLGATDNWNPDYLVAIVSGVLLALAFQLILTALSVAIGVTAIGDLKSSYIEGKYGTGSDAPNEVRERHDFDQDSDTGTSMGVKITSGFGIWSILTTCLSLFAATWIAVRMSIFSIDGTDLATGLVIWALFFIILFYLEFKAANTVIGGLINTALSEFAVLQPLYKTRYPHRTHRSWIRPSTRPLLV